MAEEEVEGEGRGAVALAVGAEAELVREGRDARPELQGALDEGRDPREAEVGGDVNCGGVSLGVTGLSTEREGSKSA